MTTHETHEHEWERGAHMGEAFGVDGRVYACAICGKLRPGSAMTTQPDRAQLAEVLAPMLPQHIEGSVSFPSSADDRTWIVYDWMTPDALADRILAANVLPAPDTALRAALGDLIEHARYFPTNTNAPLAKSIARARAALAATPTPAKPKAEAPTLDVETLWQVLEGFGVIANGTWVSFQREDADAIAGEYALRALVARLTAEAEGAQG